MKTIKKVLLVLTVVFTANSLSAQSSVDLGVDVQSRYVWRGLQFGGASPSIQPYVEFSSGNLAIGAWAAYSTGGANTAQEADLYLTYSISDAISLTVTDYFFPEEGVEGSYFDYDGHVFELTASLSLGSVGITLATNVSGDKDEAGEEAYATYAEISHGFTAGDTEVGLFAGAVFSDGNGYYATEGSGLINLGISAAKEIALTESFSLPVNAALIVNPDAENIFLTVGFSL
ncbi:MAG: hypothetical protein QGH06_03305 [Lutibacter sp.]|jgi:hypothetical protein|nr:hypothetical protein [Lutibacter sp.]